MLTFSGCAASPDSEGPLKVQIPADCDRNADPVAVPGDKAGGDIRLTASHYAAALGLANRRLTKRRICEADIRARFAEGT